MKIKLLFFLLLIITISKENIAQYAPQALQPGTDAIHKSDLRIQAWAENCTVKRGLQDIMQPALGLVTAGQDANAIGPSDGQIVSLGDSGVATISLQNPLINGAGADFVIFENGFSNPLHSEEAFLELAYVSVSSDGINFYTFPSHSLTTLDSQIAGAGEFMRAEKINNLAGKYIAQYGTPFDLNDLANTPGLDVNNIVQIKITDVVGDISGAHSSKDTANNFINDPYPTPYPIGGFDLDAVGFIHLKFPASINNLSLKQIDVYPNPTRDFIKINHNFTDIEFQIFNTIGQVVKSGVIDSEKNIDLRALQNGVFIIQFSNKNNEQCQRQFVKF